ncbi:MAG: hypothetical protein LEGION0398_MBIBDBAK_00582 [Legionellaceae bacterium]
MKSTITFAEAKQYIEALNLDYLILKMCAEEYPLPRWTKEDALICADLYKKFLLLKKKYFQFSIIPTREIDEFWHNHILHTKQYMEDSQNIYGIYLHHTPLLNNEEINDLINDFEKTEKLFIQEFGITMNGFIVEK